ncbi:hypothetical protein [Aureimonas sp. AU40]|uniref:hypothetical protein n=1 Tax=Aureimonas sp. AU40 TaxID=1637747 RepID=UPI0012E3B39E|nr:hypothetical protein [Aureimonas sp. AU40]
MRQAILDIPHSTGKTWDLDDASFSEPSEQQFLAAYLADLLPAAARHSDDAVSLLKRAVEALDPLVDLPDINFGRPARPGASPVAALAFAVRDLTPGTGPHLWVSMAIEILKGHRLEALGTS